MNKKMLIDEVAIKSGLTKVDSEKAIEAVLDTIVNEVASGNRVQLVGFGTFSKSHREARKGRNPQDGSEIDIQATDTPHFKAGKVFKGACE